METLISLCPSVCECECVRVWVCELCVGVCESVRM